MAAGERGAGEAEETRRPVASLSFEEAMAELEQLVQRLERGQLDLEAAIAAYERGTELRRHCARKLEEAELRVEKLGFGPDGRPTVEPLAERA